MGGIERLDLHRLDLDETRHLVDAIVGSDAGAELAARIHRRSDGNPFFVEELLASNPEATGAEPLPNHISGIALSGGGQRNRIGTDGDGVDDGAEGNVISGNRNDGVTIGYVIGEAPPVGTIVVCWPPWPCWVRALPPCASTAPQRRRSPRGRLIMKETAPGAP